MPSVTLHAVSALLQTASALLEEITNEADPLLARLLRVFTRMPAEDRGPILGVLEREVELRLITKAPGEKLTGFGLAHPNPNARLYARVFSKQTPYQSRDEIMRAMLRAARMMVLAPPAHRDEWETATLDAVRQLEPGERAAIARHNRDMLALLERFEREAAKAS